MLRALLEHLAEPYLRDCAVISIGPGSLADRIEQIIALSIESIDGIAWLKGMLSGDLFRGDLDIFSAAHKSIAGGLIRSMLEAAAEAGEWAPPDDVERMLEWVLRQILMLGAENYESPAAIRQRVALYVMPILGLAKPPDLSSQIISRLDAIETAVFGAR